jgi:nucleoside-diphosphate-sugar epimerase
MMDLVTGATGFVGPHLVDALVRRGARVRCAVREASRARGLEAKGAEVLAGSFEDEAFVSRAVQGVDRVFHLAGGGKVSASSDEGLATLRAANVAPVAALLRAMRGGKARFVHFSSISAMGVQIGERLDESTPCRALTPHEVAKRESEEVALVEHQDHGTAVVILRPSQIYGPGDVRSEILKLVRLARRGAVPLFGGGEGRVPWVYIDDVVDAALLAADSARAVGRTYIVSDRDSYRFADVVTVIAHELGRARGGVVIPRAVAAAGIGVVEALAKAVGKEPPFTLHRLDSMCGARLLSIDRARSELGLEPKIGLEEGMRRTVRWYREQRLV